MFGEKKKPTDVSLAKKTYEPTSRVELETFASLKPQTANALAAAVRFTSAMQYVGRKGICLLTTMLGRSLTLCCQIQF